MSPRRFPFGQETTLPLPAPQSTLPVKPIPEQAPAPWATTATATAPLSGSPVSGVRERLTEPVPTALRSPVLPFQAVPPEPLPRKKRTWPLAVAVASVVTMLLVTAAQVAVELRRGVDPGDRGCGKKEPNAVPVLAAAPAPSRKPNDEVLFLVLAILVLLADDLIPVAGQADDPALVPLLARLAKILAN